MNKSPVEIRQTGSVLPSVIGIAEDYAHLDKQLPPLGVSPASLRESKRSVPLAPIGFHAVSTLARENSTAKSVSVSPRLFESGPNSELRFAGVVAVGLLLGGCYVDLSENPRVGAACTAALAVSKTAADTLRLYRVGFPETNVRGLECATVAGRTLAPREAVR